MQHKIDLINFYCFYLEVRSVLLVLVLIMSLVVIQHIGIGIDADVEHIRAQNRWHKNIASCRVDLSRHQHLSRFLTDFHENQQSKYLSANEKK